MRWLDGFKNVPLGAYIVLTWLVLFCVLAGSVWLFLLLLPVYWQLYLKEDVVRAWL